ncbi:pentapeptide repeat-containing protein [Corallococcus exiguus]|uniref:pentapeptide repeat-containing protein n=1 Tax=Corallococcus exiguus TaxID=83462 RepID=UPI00156016EA|nr:pentapeptide repeat-containing protein [Corallococcus exiguus]NRD55152.1 pentapeptide repeat-containing protein [Corallococcus exiguus]
MADTPLPTPPPKSTHDTDHRRATCGVHYPQEDVEFNTKEDLLTKIPSKAQNQTKSHIKGKRLGFQVVQRNFESISFRECNFYNKQGAGIAKIQSISFKDCEFQSCFLGSTIYYRVRFQDCQFDRCDFMNADFEECIFERCEFKDCTADNCLLSKTEIDPTPFFSGTPFPQKNHSSSEPAFKQTSLRTWLEVRMRLAEQVFRSNSEAQNSDYTDSALFHLKTSQLARRKDVWLHGSHRPEAKSQGHLKATLSQPRQSLRLILSTINLWLTAGGTSLTRLVGALVTLTLAYPVILVILPVKYLNTQCEFTTDTALSIITSYINLSTLALSLLLGFGFSAFTSQSTLGNIALVAGATFGVIWYALLIPVIIRRIYR